MTRRHATAANHRHASKPDVHPAAKAYKQALVEDGIPITSFAVDDVNAVHDDLAARGVTFTQAPTTMGQCAHPLGVFDFPPPDK
ncbi:VOC family protein [uncultured Aeromicrobium sp.]|uniref:VOC family protein n=1 Tax=uncultured Aeromicrobium sp. TaxID=337820 RepID=UPI0034189FA6